ncbi:MAG: TrbG/VirB9 family P-type conjugative transfer protein [Rhodothermales bacterium]
MATAPAWAQQPAPERVIDITGSLEGAIEMQVQQFKQGGRPEVLRLSDVLIYPLGVYQPVLTCTVLRACIIELQPGETLISLVAGDDQRWLIDHTVTGHGGDTPLVTVKPTDHNVTTNLVISTDRRVYHVTLDSPPRQRRETAYNPLDHYTRHIKFYYPAESVRRITQREDLMRRQQQHLITKAGPGLGLTELSYNYGWRRKKGFSWEPVTVFDDGERVYIKLPREATKYEQPLLVMERDGEDQIVNYLVRDDFYIVDRLFSRARLVLSRTKRTGLFRRKRQVQEELHIFPLPR